MIESWRVMRMGELAAGSLGWWRPSLEAEAIVAVRVGMDLVRLLFLAPVRSG